MPDAVATNLVFIAVERKDTRNGKERYIGRTADGREFGIWDRNLADAVQAHLHEDLLAEVSSRQDDRGQWWNNLQSLPALGIQQAPRQSNGQGQPQAQVMDLTPLTAAVERVALALDNLLAFQMDKFMAQQGPLQVVPDDDGPPEP